MALILAIEPDRRQASHLTAMVRGRLHAEFVIGDSAERALAALGDRVPDLVLTTALLSPKDETELTDRLRALDGAAAHVQTLTIPVLASPNAKKAGKSGGMLSALLGDKGDDGPVEGCDPAFFAEQCKEYLDRAATDKAASQEQHHDEHETLNAAPAAIEPEPLDIAEPIAAVATEEVHEALDVQDLPQREEAEAMAEFADPAPVETPAILRRSRYTIADDDEAPSSLMAAVAALAEEEPAEATESFAAAAVEPFAAPATEPFAEAASEPEQTVDDAFADFDLSSMLEDPARVKPAAQAFEPEQPAVEIYELDASAITVNHEEPADTVSEVHLYTPLARPEVRTWPILEGLATGGGGEHVEAEPAAAAAPERREPDEHELAEWSDIIEALRRDAQPVALDREQFSTARAETFELPNLLVDEPLWPAPAAPQVEAVEAVPPAPVELASPAESAAEAAAVAETANTEPAIDQGNNRRKRGRKASVEDEWGFFDPDRAGFAALLAKLEEITEDDSAKTQRT